MDSSLTLGGELILCTKVIFVKVLELCPEKTSLLISKR